jgi:internalin A
MDLEKRENEKPPIEIARERIKEARQTGAKMFDLSGLELTELPAEIGDIENLRNLNLYGNQLTGLPETIGKLVNLQYLSLSGNQLTGLPETIGKLVNLRYLSLSGNQLTGLSEVIGKLANLQGLILPNNQLMELPEAIGNLANLRLLNLDENHLTGLPEAIGNLKNLQELYLHGNQLTALPETIGNLANLLTLDLGGNQLMALPKALQSLRKLRELNLRDNEALAISPEIISSKRGDISRSGEYIVAADPDTILDYYFRPRRPLNEARLILVGSGAVGKTSLINQLVHGSFNPEESETQGVSITKWQPDFCGDDPPLLHVWDFAGQEINHQTHQFFLSRRSLYLLVLNGRKGHEEADAEYWLNLIRSFGGDSPVLIALNKYHESPFELDRHGLTAKFPGMIRGFIQTDCNDRNGHRPFGIDELRKAIHREIDQLDGLREGFPECWFAIKDRMSKMPENYLTYERFREVCTELGESIPTDQDRLAGHLHNLGIALNYKDDPRLRDMHVLNPHWLTNGIYTLLNANEVKEDRGEIDISLLERILDRQDYPLARHDFLMQLMSKFELCFEFPDKPDYYLIPNLLTKERPKAVEEFDPKTCLNFQYQYPAALPEGLIPQFIVRNYTLIEDQLYWRTGVILSFEKNRALVWADLTAKRVFVSVEGPVASRRRLLAVIRSDFERLHARFQFKPEEGVPVPGHPAVVIPYRELWVREEKKRFEFEVIVGDDIINLNARDLLDGVDLEGARGKEKKEGMALKLFYSYSHEDETLRDRLGKHVESLQRQGKVVGWHDRLITAGTEWKGEIDKNLEEADIILLLVSADFVASDYCYDIEMKRAMERHKAGEARVIPIILQACNWETAPFGKLQVLPHNGKAVALWSDREEAWTIVLKGIEKAVKEIQALRKSP